LEAYQFDDILKEGEKIFYKNWG